MATLTGYNPNVSLLPAGSGTIQHMSGGGMGMPPTANYNANASLLPSAGGEIGLYKGEKSIIQYDLHLLTFQTPIIYKKIDLNYYYYNLYYYNNVKTRYN